MLDAGLGTKFNLDFVHGHESSMFERVSFGTFNMLVGVLQIISGVILVQIVFAIRSFYQRREEKESVS